MSVKKIEVINRNFSLFGELFNYRLLWTALFDALVILFVLFLFRHDSFTAILGKGTLIAITLIILRDFYLQAISKTENQKAVQKEFKTRITNLMYRKITGSDPSKVLRNRHEVITVMFVDLRGFTTLSEKLTPESTFTLINNYLSRMSEIIVAHEGTVDKYIGDAIMAFWNAPIKISDHEEKAIKCALELHKEFQRFANEIGQEMSIGIGLNSGVVSVGNVGNIYNSDYTVIGDNVNLASRIEGLTKKYKLPILVSESVYKRANDALSEHGILLREIDNVIVSGRKAPLKIYQPLEMNSENKSLKFTYERALELCRQQEYGLAIKALRKLTDLPSKVLLERTLSMYKSKTVWDGIWVWDSK